MRKFILALLLGAAAALSPAQKRLVLIDQDGSGPGGSNQMAMLALLQAPRVEVLGITMVTGNAWRDEETLHTLRMLELTGHANIPVAKGAVFPLVRDRARRRGWLSRSTARWPGWARGDRGRRRWWRRLPG
jgi:purine nucleosidase